MVSSGSMGVLLPCIDRERFLKEDRWLQMSMDLVLSTFRLDLLAETKVEAFQNLIVDNIE